MVKFIVPLSTIVPKPEPKSPSVAHQIDALTERAELAEGLMAQMAEGLAASQAIWVRVEGNYNQIVEELRRRNQDIADLQITNRNLSRKIAYEIARSKNGS